MGMDKRALRKQFMTLRTTIPVDERERVDEAIARNMFELPEYQKAETLLAYLNFGSEINTRRIIQDAWDAGKTVALPACIPDTHEMTWHRVDSFEGLVHSKLGVDEPPYNPSTEIDPLAIDNALAIVPGLTFDARGFRLGYGGGFYDVFLTHFSGETVGLCRTAQFSDRVEALDPHDRPVHIVVTENEVIRA